MKKLILIISIATFFTSCDKTTNGTSTASDKILRDKVEKDFNEKFQREDALAQFGMDAGEAHAFSDANSVLRTLSQICKTKEELIEKMEQALSDSSNLYQKNAEAYHAKFRPINRVGETARVHS